MVLFQNISLSSAKLRIAICKVSEVTSLSMTSFHFDLNPAAICVDVLFTMPASFSRTSRKCEMARKIGFFMKILLCINGSYNVTIWKEITTDVRQLVRLLSDNKFISPRLNMENVRSKISVKFCFELSCYHNYFQNGGVFIFVEKFMIQAKF